MESNSSGEKCVDEELDNMMKSNHTDLLIPEVLLYCYWSMFWKKKKIPRKGKSNVQIANRDKTVTEDDS